MSRILIAGCGYVGAATADLFHRAGWEVEGWMHSAASAAELAAKPYPVRAVDICGSEVAGDFEVVIHCASSGGGGAEAYQRIYLEGARNLLQKLRPHRLIFTSSTSVYAQTTGEWVDEESAAEPALETGRILRAAEELVRQSGGTIARLAGIYGPGRSALLRKFLADEAGLDGDGSRYLNHIHRDDVAAALFLFAGLPNEGMVVNVADDEPITQRAAYEWLAERLARPLPPRADRPEKRKRGASNKRVRNAKLRSLGWKPLFPNFASGMEGSVLPAAGELRR
jgi:nucleoside-diphosphate-sugar epimerase